MELEKIAPTTDREELLLSAATGDHPMLVEDLPSIKPLVKQHNAAILFPGQIHFIIPLY